MVSTVTVENLRIANDIEALRIVSSSLSFVRIASDR
jgi:hypothetical protein